MKCDKCECDLEVYYVSYKALNYTLCPHCLQRIFNAGDEGRIAKMIELGLVKEVSYNEEYKKFLEMLESM